jgi:hypothetical protein
MRCCDRLCDTAGVAQAGFDAGNFHAASVANDAPRGNPADNREKRSIGLR